jgi:hypothetical protein
VQTNRIDHRPSGVGALARRQGAISNSDQEGGEHGERHEHEAGRLDRPGRPRRRDGAPHPDPRRPARRLRHRPRGGPAPDRFGRHGRGLGPGARRALGHRHVEPAAPECAQGGGAGRGRPDPQPRGREHRLRYLDQWPGRGRRGRRKTRGQGDPHGRRADRQGAVGGRKGRAHDHDGRRPRNARRGRVPVPDHRQRALPLWPARRRPSRQGREQPRLLRRAGRISMS